MKHVAALALVCVWMNAASQPFSHADSLRGMLTPVRTCYDVTFYHLDIRLNVSKRSIAGSNTIAYKTVTDFDSLQIDLFANMVIDSIVFQKNRLRYRRDANAVFVKFNKHQTSGTSSSFVVYYHGKPQVALNPPWDGGFVWSRDVNGQPWIGVACQGTGASCWWPCKDHQSDEPDSMRMDYTVPGTMRCAANGRLLRAVNNPDETTTWQWAVSYPINNYNVTLNLANYTYFNDYYVGITSDTLTLEYYVLAYNAARAKEHFKQVKNMLGCYEKYFGPYPFYRDGYKLVETTYWGMEHQSAISYGNAFLNNAEGFDYIIVHESAHEWWGNNLSCQDNADMWLHESFATYAEALYVECMNGYDAGVKYMKSIRWHIEDKHPIIGPYGINFQGTANDNDMYYKGAWVLHTFRNELNNDTLFFSVLKGLQRTFGYKTTNSDEVLTYILSHTSTGYKSFFDQYLHHAEPPVLLVSTQRKHHGTQLKMKWQTAERPFNMHVDIQGSDGVKRYNVSSETVSTVQIERTKPSDVKLPDDKFYYKVNRVKPSALK